MNNFENIGPTLPNENEVSHDQEREGQKSIEEIAFENIIIKKLLDPVEDALLETGYDEREVEEFMEALDKLSSEEKKGVLSIPDTLRERTFESFRDELDAGDISIENVVKILNDRADKYGFTIGCHVSDFEIPKKKLKDGPEWLVEGSELDDRDDMKMAYYSLDYENLFRKRRGKYLYLVRANTKGLHADKQDGNNNWGRAPVLPIIEATSRVEVDRQVEEIANEKRVEKNQADAEATA